MRTPPLFCGSIFALCGLIALALLGGCSTFSSRAGEKAAVFAALDGPTQARLREGNIKLGDTADMVYIALGNPDEIKDLLSKEGPASLWIFYTEMKEYVGEQPEGFFTETVTNPKTGATTTIARPIQRSIYRYRLEETLRLTLKDGAVTAIERTRD